MVPITIVFMGFINHRSITGGPHIVEDCNFPPKVNIPIRIDFCCSHIWLKMTTSKMRIGPRGKEIQWVQGNIIVGKWMQCGAPKRDGTMV